MRCALAGAVETRHTFRLSLLCFDEADSSIQHTIVETFIYQILNVVKTFALDSDSYRSMTGVYTVV